MNRLDVISGAVSVIPAKAGIQGGVFWTLAKVDNWVPAFAGMTGVTGFMFTGGERRHDG